jgi:hypothetical protein
MVDHLADCRANLFDGCRALGMERRLHLHSFEHHQHIARFDLLPFGNRQFHHFTGHRRRYFRSCQSVCASNAPGVDRYEFELSGPSRDPNRASQTRSENPGRPPADSNNAAMWKAGFDCGNDFFATIQRHACRFVIDCGEFNADFFRRACQPEVHFNTYLADSLGWLRGASLDIKGARRLTTVFRVRAAPLLIHQFWAG